MIVQSWVETGREDPVLLRFFAGSSRWHWDDYLKQYWPAAQACQKHFGTPLIEDSPISCQLGTTSITAPPWALLLFAVHLLHHDAPGPAIVVLEQIRPIAAQTPLLFIHLGIAYKALANSTTDAGLAHAAATRAIAYFQECLVLDLHLAMVYRHLGDIHGSLGNVHCAAACWRKYLELDPDGAFSDQVQSHLARLAPPCSMLPSARL